MAKLKVLKAFTWAHEGIHVKTHEPGEVLDRAEPALIKAAPRLGWAVLLPDAPPSPRPVPAAPPARGADAAPQDPAGTAPAGSPAAGTPGEGAAAPAAPAAPPAAPEAAPAPPPGPPASPVTEKVGKDSVQVFQGSRSARRKAKG